MKIAKNSKMVKLPKATTSVARSMRAANQAMKEQRWKKCVVIGEGPHGYHISNSRMTYYELFGFIIHALLEIDREASE